MIDILVPVLDRPWQVAPFLESVKNTVSEHRVYFICSPGDEAEIAACEESGAEVMIVPFQPGPGDYAKKINWGFEHTSGEWIFQGADDIRFGPNWDANAFALWERRTAASVIGTNDLGNPSVMRGRTSTHSLIKRSYIEEYGGTIDDSGKVFCELYDHQWVDTEFSHTAIQRKVFLFAKNSIVEHLHPHWGKSEIDTTYKKSFRKEKKDRLLFTKRMRLVKDKTRLERRARAA